MNGQRGVVLITVLTLLLMLTVAVTAGAGLAGLQQRMAFNSQQQLVAFHAAESGLRAWLDQPFYEEEGLLLDLITDGALMARAKVTVTASFDCTTSVDPKQLSGRRYECKEISSLAKACNEAAACDVNIADGQARVLHRRSTPPVEVTSGQAEPESRYRYYWMDEVVIE